MKKFKDFEKLNETIVRPPVKRNFDIDNSFDESTQTVQIRFNLEGKENPYFLETITEVIEKYLEKNGVYDYGEIKLIII